MKAIDQYRTISGMTRVGWVVILAFLGSACLAEQATAADRPNVILIMADDLGYECIGANGGTSYKTPNLDRLAKEGIRFDRCYVQPLCTPTRVQLMTGMYNVRNYTRFGHLDTEQTTFGNLFQKAGYVTGIAGKWQLGRDVKLPNHFGFQEHVLWQLTRRPPRYANPGLEINGVEKDFQNGEYGPDLVNQFAVDFIARHKNEPFFLYYPMMLTHAPFQPTPDGPNWDPTVNNEKAKNNVRNFAQMVTYMDKMVGNIAAALDKNGIRDKTLLIFLGDNGTGRGVTSQIGGQAVFGGKGLPRETGMHVPLIANWPTVIPPGQVCDDLVDSTDFLPTICAAAKVEIPSELPIDGRSFLPQLKGEKGSPREWIYCWYAREGGARASTEFAMTKDYKLYRDGRLFDMAKDPLEKHPIDAKASGLKATAAVGLLTAAMDQYVDVRPARIVAQSKMAAGALDPNN